MFLKRSALLLFLVLASFGIGLSGGIPIPPSSKRKETIEINVTLLDSEEDETESVSYDHKI